MTVTIGVDGHVLTGRFQGTRTTLSGLLRALAPRLGKYRLIVYSDNPVEARAFLSVGGLEHRDLSHAGSIGRLLRVLPRLFKRDNVDFGVFQYMVPLTGRHIVFIHDLLPVSHPHLFPWKMRIRTRIFFSLAIRRSAMVLTVSEYTRSELLRRFPRAAAKTRTVLNGPSFPLSVYEAVSVTQGGSRYILTVGRIEPRKNIKLLVDALIKAAVPNVKLIVIGSFDLGYNYRPPQDAPVEIRSGVGDAELIKLFQGASLFAYPSEAEGFGVPLLDATLFGLPVVSSDRTALPEVAGDLAVYFNPTAADAIEVLAARIRGHFTGEKPIRRPSEIERKEQAARFSWDRAAEAFLSAVDAAKK